MRRRQFLTLAGAAAVFPRLALGQQAKLPRIAVVWTPQDPLWVNAFRQGLADYGYLDGQTMKLQFFVAATANDLQATAAKAAQTKPDLIFSIGHFELVAAGAPDIPIVSAAMGDPFVGGYVASLSHPGGNVTGTSVQAADLPGKQLAILTEIIPALKTLAVLYISGSQSVDETVGEMEKATSAAGVKAVRVEFQTTDDFGPQLARAATVGAQAMYVPATTYFPLFSDQLADFQIARKLPMLVPGVTTHPRALVGYGPDAVAIIRRTAGYVDAILHGAHAGDLPVEQPTVFDLGVNLSTAKAIGITIPPSILAQATIVTQ